MVYYVESTYENIFTACGLESMLEKTKRENNDEIERDLQGRTPIFRTSSGRETIRRLFSPPITEEEINPIRHRYLQGDPDGGNLKLLFGEFLPSFEANDPEDSMEDASGNKAEPRSAFIDSDGQPSAVAIFYRKDRPEEWIIVVAKNTHLPHEQREAYIMSSINPEIFLKNKELIHVQMDKSISEYREKLQEVSKSPAVSAMLANIFDEKNETLKAGANLFYNLFSESFFKDQPFDEDERWMPLMERSADKIMKNPILIALSSMTISLNFITVKLIKDLSYEQLVKCLDERSDLSIKLTSMIADNETPMRIKLALNLDALGYLKEFSKFSGDEYERFTHFFNALVMDSKNHELLQLALKDDSQKLNGLRLISACKNSNQLIKLLQEKPQNYEMIIDKLMQLDQLIKEADYQPKNVIVLPQAIQFLIAHPDVDVNGANFKKIIGFLNQAPGVEKIKPDHPGFLSSFLFDNLEDDELLSVVKETLAKLVTLNVTNLDAYALALNSKPFRDIVSDLGDGEADKKKSQERVELAINLEKLGQLSAYDELSMNLQRVLSFNQLIKNSAVKNVLHQKLASDGGVESCLKILDNSLLIALVNEKITFSKEQVDKIVDSNSDLANKLREIFSGKETDQPRKNALCQLALDLNKLDVLEAYDELEKDETQFLTVFHQMVAVGCDLHLMSELPESSSGYKNSYIFIKKDDIQELYYVKSDGEYEKATIDDFTLFEEKINAIKKKDNPKLHLSEEQIKEIVTSNGGHTLATLYSAESLKAMLEGFSPGLTKLQLMVHSDNGVELFKKYLASETNVDNALRWLERNKDLAPNIRALAMELLFGKPDINIETFKKSVDFLKTTPKINVCMEDIKKFLLNYCDNQELLAEVQVTFRKLDEIGISSDHCYKIALGDNSNSKQMRKIVHHLPPLSMDKVLECSLMKIKVEEAVPTVELLELMPEVNTYILTKDKLLYYDASVKKLQSIELSKTQLEQLNTKFPESIEKLSSEQLKDLTTNAPIIEHNKACIVLAESLSTMKQLDKYEHLAYDNQLVSAFNKFAQHPIMLKILEERLSANDLAKSKELLENQYLNALLDAKICPTKYQQINQLLDSESEKSKAMDALLTLNLKNETVYKWAFIDTTSADKFRKVLISISKDQTIDERVKPQMIQTLCLLQMEKRDAFGLFLKNDEASKKFQQAIIRIENNCDKIKTRLLNEAPEKAEEFIAADQAYRKGLYEVVHDCLLVGKKVTKEEFEANIEKSSKPMLDVVDQDRHPWLRRALAALVNTLNILFFATLPVRYLTGKSIFYYNTKSGEAVRDLHDDLKKDLSSEFAERKGEPENTKKVDESLDGADALKTETIVKGI